MFFERIYERVAAWFAPADPNAKLGPRGENLAAKHLRSLGYKILHRNWRCKVGEIDLIARDGRTLVFVEVKTRAEESPEPEQQVDAFKRQQVARAAEFFLSRYSLTPPPARFDVVAIVCPRFGQPTIRHHRDAFAIER